MGRRKGSINKSNKLPKGVTEVRDGKHDKKPFLVCHKGSRKFYATAAEAIARKRELVELEAKEGRQALDYSREVHADVVAARRVLPTEVSLLKAAEFWRSHHPETTIETSEAVERFVVAKREQSINPDGWTPYTRDVNTRLAPFAMAFADRLLNDVTAAQIRNWINGLRSTTGDHLSPRSINNYRLMLDSFFNFAVRRKWVNFSPMKEVLREDFPVVRPAGKNPLTIAQANGLLDFVKNRYPEFLVFFALRLYLGVRTAEAHRFRWEWIQPQQKRIFIPGIYKDAYGRIQRGTKTGDDWAIYDVAPRFWCLVDAVDLPSEGKLPSPCLSRWEGFKNRDGSIRAGIRDEICKELGIKSWPHNATRDTFCTLHMSAYQSPERTALILKHRNHQTLWQSYLGTLVPQDEARGFFEG